MLTNASGAEQCLMSASFAEKCGLEHKTDRRQHSTIVGFAGSVKMIGTIYLCELFFIESKMTRMYLQSMI